MPNDWKHICYFQDGETANLKLTIWCPDCLSKSRQHVGEIVLSWSGRAFLPAPAKVVYAKFQDVAYCPVCDDIVELRPPLKSVFKWIFLYCSNDLKAVRVAAEHRYIPPGGGAGDKVKKRRKPLARKIDIIRKTRMRAEKEAKGA